MSRNTLRVLCFFVIIPLSHGSDNSVDQSTDSVCSSNLLVPFQTSQYPNGGVLRDEYGSSRLRSDPAHFWRWKGNPCHTIAYRSDPHPPVETSHKGGGGAVGSKEGANVKSRGLIYQPCVEKGLNSLLGMKFRMCFSTKKSAYQ